MRWEFERSLGYLRKQGLQEHIDFPKIRYGERKLPLISERQIYKLQDVRLRDLEIEMDHGMNLCEVNASGPVSTAKWHFEGCRFKHLSSNICSIVFSRRGSFRFYRSEFVLSPTLYESYWDLGFGEGSRVWFVENDFRDSKVQMRCDRLDGKSRTDVDITDTQDSLREGSISLASNERLEALLIPKGFSNIVIVGMNHIGYLNINLNLNEDNNQGKSIYLGPREKVDASFNNCLHHRSLFLSMRRMAANNHDNRQLSILDRQLDRIEYFLNKERDAFSTFSLDLGIEYWQDRALYAWRRWSSDFHRSWSRPLVLLIVGYVLLNALPFAVVVEHFEVSHWIEFTLRPVSEIASYETTLSRILGNDYESVSAPRKMILKLVGILQVLWIGIWGFAFAKSVKR